MANERVIDGLSRIPAEGKFTKDFGPRDQIRRADVSTIKNNAEGDEISNNNNPINNFIDKLIFYVLAINRVYP
jgi:hypothetical protein